MAASPAVETAKTATVAPATGTDELPLGPCTTPTAIKGGERTMGSSCTVPALPAIRSTKASWLGWPLSGAGTTWTR